MSDQPEQPSQPEPPDEVEYDDAYDAAYDAYTETQPEPPVRSEMEDVDDPAAPEMAAETETEREASEVYSEVYQSVTQPVTQTATLNAADVDAAADLARPSRVMQFRAQRRTQLSMAIPALLLIAVGVVYLAETVTPDTEEAPRVALLLIGATGLGLGLLARFLLNGRRERGLFMLGAVILLWAVLAALVASGGLLIEQAWPFGVAAFGVAMLLTFIFERSHERGLILPALAFMAAAGMAIPITTGLIPPDLLEMVTLFWPLLFLLVALLLLPRAIRARE